MGAVDFSLSSDLVDMLTGSLPLEVFVETGTFEGDTVARMAGRFRELHSVELSPEHFHKAVKRFREAPHVHIALGNSPDFLATLRPGLGERAALYYLDAHWCVASNAAGEHSQCPLLEEIAAIGRLSAASVLLIDDARLFLAPPPEPHDVYHWPAFDAIVDAVRRLSPAHELMVVNDVIAFYPKAISSAVAAYAHRHGVDWLRARQSLEENGELRALLAQSRRSGEEKEAAIAALDRSAQEKEAAIAALDRSAQEKEAAIAALDRSAQEKEAVIAEIRQVAEQHSRAVQEKNLIIQTMLQEKARAEADRADASPRQEAGGAASDGVAHLLMKKLEDKEAVICELSTALDAYRATFSVLGILIIPFNHLVLGTRSVLRRTRRLVAPRLGVLNQHAPCELRLPAHYARASTLTDAPRISIVTPTFRQADFIERTIRSVLDQGYPDLEYFVQDGGSEDGTRAILRRYADRLAGWDSRPDNGQTQAINRGFARTSGEIMSWLNSDDLMLPGALAYIADFFQRHPEVDVVYGHRILIDENDRQIGRWMMPPHDDEVLSWADYVPQETLFWRRRIWDKAGGRVDESFRFAMDWELLVRFREAGARFARLPRFIGGFRIHPHQKTSAAIADVGFEEMNRIRERVLGRVPTPKEISRAVFPYLLSHLGTELAWRIRSRLGYRS